MGICWKTNSLEWDRAGNERTRDELSEQRLERKGKAEVIRD